MLLNDLMPVYDVVERHRTVVDAVPAVVFRAIREADLGGEPLTRALLAVRAIPAGVIALARSPRAARAEWRVRRSRRGQGLRLTDFERAGCRVVAERAPEELMIGLLGKFWTPRGGLRAEVTTLLTFATLQVGYSLALFQLSKLITVYLGHRYFQERNTGRRALGSLVMVIGAMLIVAFGRRG